MMARSIAEAQSRVSSLAERLLPGWEVRVEPEYPSDCDPSTDQAVTAWTNHTYEAVISFTDEALGMRAYDFDRLVMHELLHPLFREMRQHFNRMLDDLGEDSARDAKLYEHNEELIVERIARAVYFLRSGA